MKRLTVLILALLALYFGSAALAGEQCDNYLEYGKAVARLGENVSKGDIEDVLASRLLMRSKKPMTNLADFEPIAIVAGPDNHYTVQFDSPEKATLCMEALADDPNVKYVHQDGLVSIAATDDLPAAGASKANPYKSWGALPMGADYFAASIKAAGSVTVAVVDTGVGSHPFLNSRVKISGADFIKPSNNNGRQDGQGHGTHVAGTVVDLTQGLKVNILPVRVLDDDGYGAESAVANGIRYAADAGAKVINLSLSGETISPYEAIDSDQKDCVDYAVSKGATLVVSAGNASKDTNLAFPACFDNVIVVAAIDSAYKQASFSSFGDSVDVAAPGVNVVSCSVSGGFTSMSGTSMSAPHVAAIAAMVKLANPKFSPAQVESFIKANCRDLGDEGWDRIYGFGMPCFVDDKTGQEGDYTYLINEDGCVITQYSGGEADIILPETLGGCKVVGISEEVFYKNQTIETLVVPGCVREIGTRAFSDCPNLKSVTLKDGVERIGYEAFRYCRALEYVSLPDTLRTIDGNAFRVCKALKDIALPDKLESIGPYALGETGLVSFTVPAGVSRVPAGLLAYCRQLETLEISEGVKEIEASALRECESLKHLSLPESVTTIKDWGFWQARFETIDMPGVTSIGNGAFQECANLKSLELPDALSFIGQEAFGKCEALESITIPEGVAIIKTRTFANCPQLTKVTFPRSLQAIHEAAFEASENVSIHGFTGSIAEKAATKLNIPFVSIGYMVPLTKLSPTEGVYIDMTPSQRVVLANLYTVEPKNATEKTLDWTCSDESVCVIEMYKYGNDDLLTVRAEALGQCVIKGTSKDGSGLVIEFGINVGDNPPRQLRLDKHALSLAIGETAQLNATVLPEEASQQVAWTSLDTGVATVADGLVTAVSIGTTSIVARSGVNEELSSVCEVTVLAPPPATGTFKIRPIDQGTAAITGYEGSATDISIPAEIDGLKIVLIDEKAFFKSKITSVAISEGVEAIGEKAFAGCKKLGSARLPASLVSLAYDAFSGCDKLPKVKSLSFNLTDSGEGFIVTPVFTPANTAAAYSVTAPKKKASVEQRGLVIPKSGDYFKVTIKSSGRKAVIGVAGGEPYAPGSVKIKGKAKRSLKMGKTLSLAYTVKPESARVVASWSSSDNAIATVSPDGVVTPIAPGTVKITLDTDAGLSDFVTITVKAEGKK